MRKEKANKRRCYIYIPQNSGLRDIYKTWSWTEVPLNVALELEHTDHIQWVVE